MTWVLLLLVGAITPVKVTGYQSEDSCKFAGEYAQALKPDWKYVCIPGPEGKAQE